MEFVLRDDACAFEPSEEYKNMMDKMIENHIMLGQVTPLGTRLKKTFIMSFNIKLSDASQLDLREANRYYMTISKDLYIKFKIEIREPI